MTRATRSVVASHYARGNLFDALRERLPALKPRDIAGVDEFHVRGRAATLELAAKLAPAPDSIVLDIGSGLGGPSRLLHQDYGCRVVGIDLTSDYCRAACLLSDWLGLGRGVAYLQADALALPFPDGAFDAAWTQHVQMNIADKHRLYAEVYRVLKPGGKFALYDVLRGGGEPPRFPVPWARTPETSHLATADELRRLLGDAGLIVESWRDSTADALAWFAELERRQRQAPPPALDLRALLGPDFPAMARNLRRNLEEGRVLLVEAVCRRQ